MINELFVVISIFVGGCALARVLGVTGWPLPAVGLVAGVCLQITVGFIQAATALPTSPLITLAVTLLGPATWWVLRLRAGEDVKVRWLPALLSIAGLAASVAVLRVANLFKWHTDSIAYLTVGRLLAEGDFFAYNTTHLVTTRVLGIPLLHAPANIDGGFYLRSITPLLAAATIGVAVWLLREAMTIGAGRMTMVVATVLMLLLFLTNNRVIHSFFYINGHLLTGYLVMVIAASAWLLAIGHPRYERVLMALHLLAIPPLIVVRPEGSLMGVLILAPMWLSKDIDRNRRTWSMAVFGVSTILLSLLEGWFFLDRREPLPSSVLGPLALGVVVLLAIPLLRAPFLPRHSRALLWLTEIGLWVSLLALGLYYRGSGTLRNSVDATYVNLFEGAGAWGLSIVILVALLGLGLVLARPVPYQLMLRFPLTTFVPFVFLMAYFREGSYRIGLADSLNRMIMHVVPLAVLLLLILVTVGDRREPTAGSDADPDARPRVEAKPRVPLDEGSSDPDQHLPAPQDRPSAADATPVSP
jgi:hypothetical protein